MIRTESHTDISHTWAVAVPPLSVSQFEWESLELNFRPEADLTRVARNSRVIRIGNTQ